MSDLDPQLARPEEPRSEELLDEPDPAADLVAPEPVRGPDRGHGPEADLVAPPADDESGGSDAG